MGERIDASSALALDTGGSSAYVPGGPPRRWRLHISDASARAYGMQLTVRASSDPARLQAGDLRALDSTMSVVCGDERFKGSTGCLPSAPLQFLHHTAPRPEGLFEFEWTPPVESVGAIDVYVAANASVSGQRNSRIHLRTFHLKPLPVASVTSGAPGQPVIAPGSWLSVFGEDLASTGRSWRDDDFRDGALPDSLDGVRVAVGGKPAFVARVHPTRVDAIVPDGVPSGDAHVEVSRDGSVAAVAVGRVGQFAPALFATPEGWVAKPARPGEIVAVFGTGFGPVDPSVPAGRLFAGTALCARPVSIRLEGVGAQVLFAGLVGPGLYQINFVAPRLGAGERAIEAEVDGMLTPPGSRLLIID